MASPGRLWNLEAEGLARRHGFFDQFHPLDLLELAHRLRGLGGHLTESVVEFPQGGDLLLLVLVGGILSFVPRIPFLKEGCVVPGVGLKPALGDLINGLDDLVHELTIVGDEQDGARIGLEIVLKPEEGDKIEVVGRFVQQEKIGLHDQQPGQVGAHDPSAAQFLGLAVEVLLLVAESSEDLLGLGLHLRVTQGRMFCRGFAIFGKIGGARILEFLELLFEGGELSGATGRHIEDCLFADGLALLGEMADHGPFIPLDAAGIRLILFQDQGEEG